GVRRRRPPRDDSAQGQVCGTGTEAMPAHAPLALVAGEPAALVQPGVELAQGYGSLARVGTPAGVGGIEVFPERDRGCAHVTGFFEEPAEDVLLLPVVGRRCQDASRGPEAFRPPGEAPLE